MRYFLLSVLSVGLFLNGPAFSKETYSGKWAGFNDETSPFDYACTACSYPGNLCSTGSGIDARDAAINALKGCHNISGQRCFIVECEE